MTPTGKKTPTGFILSSSTTGLLMEKEGRWLPTPIPWGSEFLLYYYY